MQTHLIINITLLNLASHFLAPLLIHLLIRSPAQYQERTDDKCTTGNSSASERRVERWWKELIYDCDDENCEERCYG
jgi:hypothetical protein